MTLWRNKVDITRVTKFECKRLWKKYFYIVFLFFQKVLTDTRIIYHTEKVTQGLMSINIIHLNTITLS